MGAATGQAPSQVVLRARVPGRAAATATLDVSIGTAPFTGTVSAVTYAADIAITGADTNSLTVGLIDRGAAAAGSTTAAFLAATSGVNFTAFLHKTITLSGTAANLNVTAGDELTWESIKVGTGLLDPGGHVEVTLTRD